MRRGELFVVLAIVASIIAVGLLVPRATIDDDAWDFRRSTERPGPNGAKGLAAVLDALGARVEQRRRALFGASEDTSLTGGSTALVMLDVITPVTSVEAEQVRDLVAQGGTLVVAGSNGVEQCFGMGIRDVGAAVFRSPTDTLVSDYSDSVAVTADHPIGHTRWTLAWTAEEPLEDHSIWSADTDCLALQPTEVDTLMRTIDRRAVAWRLGFAGGGRVLALADSRYISNRDLKETDAGVVVIPWLLDLEATTFVFDEYHQGFGTRSSMTGLFGATGRWAISSPLGWMLLQLVFAGVVALAVAAIRFGPALTAIERRRRSPLEHVDALAVGLERAEAEEAAVRLIAAGLRRRLHPRSGGATRRTQDLEVWLEALERHANDPKAQRALGALRRVLVQRERTDRVRHAASAVEDVWEALTHEKAANAF